METAFLSRVFILCFKGENYPSNLGNKLDCTVFNMHRVVP